MGRGEKVRAHAGQNRTGATENPPVASGKRENSYFKPSKELKNLVNQTRGAEQQPSGLPPLADPGRQEISPASIDAHALATFGSMEKARHWMNRPNPLFQGKTPAQVMRTDPVGVEAELVRIDHGIYV